MQVYPFPLFVFKYFLFTHPPGPSLRQKSNDAALREKGEKSPSEQERRERHGLVDADGVVPQEPLAVELPRLLCLFPSDAFPHGLEQEIAFGFLHEIGQKAKMKDLLFPEHDAPLP